MWLLWTIMILLMLLFVMTIPVWPYSRGWGYSPGAGFLLLMIIFLVIWWIGWFP